MCVGLNPERAHVYNYQSASGHQLVVVLSSYADMPGLLQHSKSSCRLLFAFLWGPGHPMLKPYIFRLLLQIGHTMN